MAGKVWRMKWNTKLSKKIKTQLKLASTSLKLTHKKKSALAQVSRREIAQLLGEGKEMAARIRAEQLVGEERLIQALDITDLFCQVLSTRWGLVDGRGPGTEKGVLDPHVPPHLRECVAGMMFASSRLGNDYLSQVAEALIRRFTTEEGGLVHSALHHPSSCVNAKLITALDFAVATPAQTQGMMVESAKLYQIPYAPPPLPEPAADELPGEPEDLLMLLDSQVRKDSGTYDATYNTQSRGPAPPAYGSAVSDPREDFMTTVAIVDEEEEDFERFQTRAETVVLPRVADNERYGEPKLQNIRGALPGTGVARPQPLPLAKMPPTPSPPLDSDDEINIEDELEDIDATIELEIATRLGALKGF